MAEAEKELERDLVDVGNKLLSLPSDVEELISLLNLAEDFLSRVEQVPSVSMRTALYPIMKALAAKYLLNHSEDVVKVALASCFSEIAIITSPVDPYNEDLMKDIFQMIVDALKNLDDSSSPIFYKKVSILENIAKVHFCVLMLNLECDDLILEMFQHFLKAIRPANAQRVFSVMETIMTTLLNESEDTILSYFVDRVLKDLKDALPIARSLVEKVTRNCVGKLKPCLIKLVQSNGTSSNEYSDIIASICQEKFDTVELNEPRNSGERLVDDRKLSAGPMSYELPQVCEAENRDKEMNDALVGAEIKVWWPDDEMFYEGAIDSFDPVSKKHTVLYFDGDVEILLLKDECWEFLQGGRKSDKRQGKENPRPGSSQEITTNKKGKKISHPVVKQETKKRPQKPDKTVNQYRASGQKSITRKRPRPRAGASRLACQRIDKMFEEFKRKAKARRNDTAVTVECSMDDPSETKGGMQIPQKASKSDEGIPQADWRCFSMPQKASKSDEGIPQPDWRCVRKADSKYDSDGACEKRKRMMQPTEECARRRPKRAYSS